MFSKTKTKGGKINKPSPQKNNPTSNKSERLCLCWFAAVQTWMFTQEMTTRESSCGKSNPTTPKANGSSQITTSRCYLDFLAEFHCASHLDERLLPEDNWTAELDSRQTRLLWSRIPVSGQPGPPSQLTSHSSLIPQLTRPYLSFAGWPLQVLAVARDKGILGIGSGVSRRSETTPLPTPQASPFSSPG